MLPTNLGETMRTVRDEAFFDLHPLRHKVLTIGTCTCTCIYIHNHLKYIHSLLYQTVQHHLYTHTHMYMYSTCNACCYMHVHVYYAARRYGITDISEEFLVLLSHGVQVCILSQVYSCTVISLRLSFGGICFLLLIALLPCKTLYQ